MSAKPTAVRIGPQTYRVEMEGRGEILYAIAAGSGAWVWWNGRAYRVGDDAEDGERSRAASSGGKQALTAPMPATVLKVNVTAGSRVSKGDVLIVLEAMKMELPLRAAADGVVTALNCRERELVQPDTILIELAP